MTRSESTQRSSHDPFIRFIRCARIAMLLALTAAAVSLPLAAQNLTGVLVGQATAGGDPLPGVTVTISSPALQGERTKVTDRNGQYSFPALPPGDYEVSFQLEGMTTVNRAVTVALAQTARANADLQVSLSEEIVVTNTFSTLETSDVSQNIRAQELDELPINRTIIGATTIAPGVSTEGPNDQIMISGAPSYENLYLLNGAVVNENLRGQPQSLFIEDAIAETTVLTGSISAEYGRLTGGVVNTITKQGGNQFSGSFRTSLSNDDWTSRTPFPGEAEASDDINERYEATLGGRLVRDRLWFFTAGRLEDSSESRNTLDTNLPYNFQENEDRYEVKLTGKLSDSHSLVGSYLDRIIEQKDRGAFSFTDLRSLDDRELPYTLFSASYDGVFTDNFLFQAQYSERDFAFVGSGADTTDLIEGTIIRGFAGSRRAWSPTFCGICEDKTRNNEYLHLKGSYLASTAGSTHDLVAGVEDFSNLRKENNEQGGSGYRVWGNFIYDAAGNTFINVDPSQSYIQFFPVLNRSLTSDGNTQSAYINDRWALGDKWSFNLGVRYDKNESIDQAGTLTADDEAFSPRISVAFDPKGDGRHNIRLGFAQYAAAIDNGVNDEASSAGSPASFSWFYRGPEINGDGNLLTTDVVLTQVFDWFFNTNCPGFTSGVDVLSCDNNLRSASVPGVNTRIVPGGLASPTMTEVSLSYGYRLGSRGFLRANYITRDWEDFYTRTTNLSTGRVTDTLGREFDLTLVGSNDAGLERKYDSVQLQGSYRFENGLSLQGNYTWADLRGNTQTEASNSATDSLQAIDSFPEYTSFSWNNPTRQLPGDVRHRANIWASYNLDTPIGRFNFSALESFNSGFPYYVAGTIDLREISNPGYLRPPTTATYFFDTEERRTDDVTRTDIAVNYTLPIKAVEVFVQADVLNLFDEDSIVDPSNVSSIVNTSRNSACRQADGSRCVRFNPMTTTPVRGVHYQLADNFGQPTSENAYQLPFTYRFSLGIRF